MALAFEVIERVPKALRPLLPILLEWYGNTEMVDQQMKDMRKVAYVNEMARHGLRTYVMKGIGVSMYYPVTTHRKCGDLDCFFLNDDDMSAYEAGNIVSESVGAHVERDYYKHSHIKYKGLTVENHQFCTSIRGGKDKKAFERHFQSLLRLSDANQIEGSNLLIPLVNFTALFFTAHSLQHFLFEKIHFRYVLDWIIFLRTDASLVDWNDSWNWCVRMKYTRFVLCLNWICHNKLGMQINIPEPPEEFNVEQLLHRIYK